MSIEKWEFSPAICQDRRDKLNGAPDFENIVRQILEGSQIICAVKDPVKSNPIVAHRVAYSLEVPSPLFDLFFNSKNGYRAWYYRSPERGLAKNSYLVKVLKPKLLTADVKGDIPPADIIKSLESRSAKAWLAEAGNPLCDLCPGQFSFPQDSLPEIYNDRWEISDNVKSRMGRKAPFLSRIRIYGGFIDSKGNEFVPPNKLHRGQEIFSFGAS
jgi:hypothetical protein